MSFASIPFLYYFLPAALAVYLLAPKRWRNGVLLAESLFFYFWLEGLFLLLLLAGVANGAVFGRLIQGRRRQGKGKALLVLSLALSLALLFVFRYLGYFWGEFRWATGLPLPVLRLTCPVGLCYYTLQTMAYVLGVWRGEVFARKSPFYLALYLLGFPWVLAGPLAQYNELALQIAARRHSLTKWAVGLRRLVVGLVKKVVIADGLGAFCAAYQGAAELSLAFTWAYVLAFVFQFYFDLSAYADLAIGVGKLFGFDLPENFRHPLAARSLTALWRRWNITVGRWFSRNLYTPLRGPRGNRARLVPALLLTWLLVGLWQGAGWLFLFWGLGMGLLLLLEKAGMQAVLDRLPLVGHFWVLLWMGAGAVFLGTKDPWAAWRFFRYLVGLGDGGLLGPAGQYYLQSYGPTLLLALVGATPWPARCMAKLRAWRGTGWLVGLLEPLVLAGLLLVATGYLVAGGSLAFWY